MFDDDEEEFADGSLIEDIERFEAHLQGNTLIFMDSDRIENIIDHYLVQGQYQKAKAASELGMYQFSYNQLFQLRKAQSLGGLGILNEALEMVHSIEKTMEPSSELFLTKASLYSQLRDHKNAIKYFHLAIEVSEPNETDFIYLDISIEFQRMRMYPEAVDVLKEALRVNKYNESALYELGRCYDIMGESQEAVKSYTEFIDEQPYSSTAWYNLGNAYSKLEDFDKAVWAYDYAILINDEFGPAHFNIGNSYLSLEKYHKAIEHFEMCQKHDGDDAMAMCYIGEAYEQLNEFDLSKHYYKKSIEMEPMLPEAWLGLGIVEDLLGNTREGIVLIQKALDFDPENAGIYHVLAGAYEKLELREETLFHYEKSLELNPADEECLSDYIDFMSNESPIEAYKVLQSYLEGEKENGIAHVLEVNLQWQLGQRSEAIRLFTHCLEKDSVKAKTIFEINPKLLDDHDFLNLSE
jgi:tetratricopeptide (TPR) repeat protein